MPLARVWPRYFYDCEKKFMFLTFLCKSVFQFLYFEKYKLEKARRIIIHQIVLPVGKKNQVHKRIYRNGALTV